MTASRSTASGTSTRLPSGTLLRGVEPTPGVILLAHDALSRTASTMLLESPLRTPKTHGANARGVKQSVKAFGGHKLADLSGDAIEGSCAIDCSSV